MTEQDLIDLGFIKNTVSPEESGIDHDYYYYELDLTGKSEIFLITPCSDELKDDNWYVTIFDVKDVKYSSKDDVKAFINLIKKGHTVKK